LQALKGEYRAIGHGRIDMLSTPEGPLWKDCYFGRSETVSGPKWRVVPLIYLYNDKGELLYEVGSYQEHADSLKRERRA